MSQVIENAVILIDDEELAQYVHICPKCSHILHCPHTFEKKKLGSLRVFKNASICPQCNKKYFGAVEVK